MLMRGLRIATVPQAELHSVMPEQQQQQENTQQPNPGLMFTPRAPEQQQQQQQTAHGAQQHQQQQASTPDMRQSNGGLANSYATPQFPIQQQQQQNSAVDAARPSFQPGLSPALQGPQFYGTGAPNASDMHAANASSSSDSSGSSQHIPAAIYATPQASHGTSIGQPPNDVAIDHSTPLQNGDNVPINGVNMPNGGKNFPPQPGNYPPQQQQYQQKFQQMYQQAPSFPQQHQMQQQQSFTPSQSQGYQQSPYQDPRAMQPGYPQQQQRQQQQTFQNQYPQLSPYPPQDSQSYPQQGFQLPAQPSSNNYPEMNQSRSFDNFPNRPSLEMKRPQVPVKPSGAFMMDATEPPPKGKSGRPVNVPGMDDVEMKPKSRPMNSSATPNSGKGPMPVGVVSSQHRNMMANDDFHKMHMGHNDMKSPSFDRSSTSTSNERGPMCPFQALAMAIEANGGHISPHRGLVGDDPHHGIMGKMAKHGSSTSLDGIKGGLSDDPAFGRLASSGVASNPTSNVHRPAGSVHSSRSGGTTTHGTGSARDHSVTHGSSSQNDSSRKKFAGGVYRGHTKKKKIAAFSKSSTPPFDEVALKVHAPLIKESWMLAMTKCSFSELGCIYYDTLFEESQVQLRRNVHHHAFVCKGNHI
jgi:hypothetical protein